MIISFSISQDLNNALDHEAALMGCSRSNLLRIIVTDYLSRQECDITSYRSWLAFRKYMMEEENKDGTDKIKTPRGPESD